MTQAPDCLSLTLVDRYRGRSGFDVVRHVEREPLHDRRGVIHRNIKPENILLEHGHAVVADFGIARAVDAAGGTQLTETRLAIGTPRYMSPEQAGESELDGRSDLYALACVLYEMLAGQPPFTGPTVESVIHQHLAVDAPPIGVR
jgi:serine/threonine-protein kinase